MMRKPQKRRHRFFDEEGTVTAEFVVALPAVLIVVAILAGTFQSQFAAHELSAITGHAARTYLVSGQEKAVALVRSQLPDATVRVEHAGELHCVTVTRTINVVGLLPSVHRSTVCLPG